MQFTNLNWLVVSIPLKNMKVNWDDDIPNLWENTSHVPNHQTDPLYTLNDAAFLHLDVHGLSGRCVLPGVVAVNHILLSGFDPW